MFNAPSLLEAKAIGDSIRAGIEQLEIEHRESYACRFVTISLGAAFLPKPTIQDLDYMIKRADNLLYEAKDKGENQCVALDINDSGVVLE